jgi:hypothetical protein
VPIDVIEWQASYFQKGAKAGTAGEWQANWQVRGRLAGWLLLAAAVVAGCCGG